MANAVYQVRSSWEHTRTGEIFTLSMGINFPISPKFLKPFSPKIPMERQSQHHLTKQCDVLGVDVGFEAATRPDQPVLILS